MSKIISEAWMSITSTMPWVVHVSQEVGKGPINCINLNSGRIVRMSIIKRQLGCHIRSLTHSEFDTIVRMKGLNYLCRSSDLVTIKIRRSYKPWEDNGLARTNKI